MAIVNIREHKPQSQPMLKQCLSSGVLGFSFEGAFQALKFGAPPTLFIKPHYRPPDFLAGRKVLPPNFTRCFTSEISNSNRIPNKNITNTLLQAWQR